MKTANQQGLLRRARPLLLSGVVSAVVFTAACMGNIGGQTGTGGAQGGPAGAGGGGPSANGSGGQGGPAGGGGTPMPGVDVTPAAMPPPAAPNQVLNPGTVPIHRLNAFEYDNTINDLLGLQQNLAETTFIPDEKGVNGFDSEADAFTMSDAEFEQYFNAADSIGEQVFASPALTAKIVTCTPSSATDAACLSTVINNFGLRAYRRPLFADEVTRFQALAADAVTNGQDFNGSVKQIVKQMLCSIPFLYRMEFDADPTSTTPHQVAPYELANRLSYLFWSSMPDAALFADAQSGAILTDATIQAQMTRMLADPKAANFVSSFAGQWLGVRDLHSHQVEPTAFPAWNETIRSAMEQEMLAYFGEFLNGDLPWTQFMTAQVNFVNGPLAGLYGLKNIPATQTTTTKVEMADPNRIGFMGLGGFLTLTSYSYRTVPTLRGKWVLLNLLGETVPSPPAGVPPLDSAANASTDSATQEENVRARLLAHRMQGAACNTCHSRLDPIGLGMENFNGIGQYRTTYGNGDPIDSSGELPDMTMFSSVVQLATILSSGTRLTEMTNYAAQQVMTYALSRPLDLNSINPLTGNDTPYLTQIQTAWGTQNYMLASLIQDVILNQTFRMRHGGV
jgi:hypothetical protein